MVSRICFWRTSLHPCKMIGRTRDPSILRPVHRRLRPLRLPLPFPWLLVCQHFLCLQVPLSLLLLRPAPKPQILPLLLCPLHARSARQSELRTTCSLLPTRKLSTLRCWLPIRQLPLSMGLP